MVKASTNQIISARLLLKASKVQVKRTGIEKAFAVLHAHDALDWTLQYLYDDSNNSKKGKLMFPDYVSAIAKHPDKFGSLDELKCDQLNTMRSNFKHNFVIPNDRQIDEIVLWVAIQIDSLLKTYTGKPLSEFDTIDAIQNKEVVNRIKESDKHMHDNRHELALSSLAIAYAILENDKRAKVEDMFGTNVPRDNSHSFTFADSHFLKLDQSLGKDFSRAWDKIIENVEYQTAMIPADLLGIEHAEYIRFRQDTPRPYRTLDGKYHVDFMDRFIQHAKGVDVGYWREFVISTAIANGL
ncbi:hypothetical protein HGB07_07270 [Candidatus Roizmanbacteria bacterium]|nr:hypothetical protein [Candidatus Roizmanbacteria bacterium]